MNIRINFSKAKKPAIVFASKPYVPPKPKGFVFQYQKPQPFELKTGPCWLWNPAWAADRGRKGEPLPLQKGEIAVIKIHFLEEDGWRLRLSDGRKVIRKVLSGVGFCSNLKDSVTYIVNDKNGEERQFRNAVPKSIRQVADKAWRDFESQKEAKRNVQSNLPVIPIISTQGIDSPPRRRYIERVVIRVLSRLKEKQAMAKTLKVARAEVVELFKALDYGTADKWNDKRLAEKLQGLPKLIDDDTEVEDEKLAKLLKSLLKAMEAGTSIELTVEEEVEEKPAKKGKKDEKPAKSSKKSQKDEDEDEDSDDEEESEEDEEEESEEEDSDDEEESEDEDEDSDEDEEEEKPAKKSSKKEAKSSKKSKKDEDEDEEEEEEDEDEEEESEDDEDSDDEDEDEDEDEKPAKKSKDKGKAKKSSKKDEDEDEDEDEKVPVKKKAPPKPGNKGPGVIQTIIKCLREASKKKPISKDKILAKLVKAFPDREEKAMKSTISSQIPSGLKTEKGLEVKTDGEGGFWLPAEDA